MEHHFISNHRWTYRNTGQLSIGLGSHFIFFSIHNCLEVEARSCQLMIFSHLIKTVQGLNRKEKILRRNSLTHWSIGNKSTSPHDKVGYIGDYENLNNLTYLTVRWFHDHIKRESCAAWLCSCYTVGSFVPSLNAYAFDLDAQKSKLAANLLCHVIFG